MDTGKLIRGERFRAGPRNGLNHLDSKNKLDQAYVTWKKDPNPIHLGSVMSASKNIIDRAITSYAPGSAPSVRSHAKILVRRAMDTYEPSKAKLSTHLFNNLRPIGREANSYTSVHVPERVSQDLAHLHEWENKFRDEKGHDSSDRDWETGAYLTLL